MVSCHRLESVVPFFFGPCCLGVFFRKGFLLRGRSASSSSSSSGAIISRYLLGTDSWGREKCISSVSGNHHFLPRGHDWVEKLRTCVFRMMVKEPKKKKNGVFSPNRFLLRIFSILFIFIFCPPSSLPRQRELQAVWVFSSSLVFSFSALSLMSPPRKMADVGVFGGRHNR